MGRHRDGGGRAGRRRGGKVHVEDGSKGVARVGAVPAVELDADLDILAKAGSTADRDGGSLGGEPAGELVERLLEDGDGLDVVPRAPNAGRVEDLRISGSMVWVELA